MKKILSVIALAAMLITAANSHAQTVVQGEITSNTTWSSDVLIRGPLFVRSGATLTVTAGTTVYGEKATLAALIIDRGAKLNAVGTKDSPVLFTSDQPAGTQARADWGGIIINGYSTLNVPGGTKTGEGDTGVFGCTAGVDCNEADNSGTLQFVRVEYGGIQFTPDNELNGIAFQAVGSGTTVDHVQVHMSKDDCIEFFGGTVSMKNAIMSACGDDSLDWTDGWRGNGQFLVVQQKGDEADRGIEADNYEFGQDNLPRSNPTLYNLTIVGDPATGSTSNRGMTIRRGTAGNIRNSIIMGFATNAGCDIDDAATFTQATAGNLIIDNNIFYNNLRSFATDSEAFLGTTMQHNETRNPLLGLPYDQSAPDFRPDADSPALDNDTVPVAAPPAGNSYIISTDYIGAVDPDNDWTRAAWTTYGEAAWTPDDCTDADEDGYSIEGGDCGQVDCNDGNAAINPGANETCQDGVDNDCDGQVDEGCDNCTDADNDTYAAEGGDCGPVDCNDGNAAINPGANETCEDGVDNDCDGQVDEGCDNATECVLTVRPATVYKFLSWVFPLRLYSLQGDGNAVLTSDDELDWGTPGIITLSARVTGARAIRGIIFVRPRLIEAGTYDVTVGNCAGTIEIK